MALNIQGRHQKLQNGAYQHLDLPAPTGRWH